MLTAQNGPEVLSIERAVSRFTDHLVIPHGISGGEAGGGLFSKNVPAAAAGLPKVRKAACGSGGGVPN